LLSIWMPWVACGGVDGVVTLVLAALMPVGPVAGMFFFADMMAAKTRCARGSSELSGARRDEWCGCGTSVKECDQGNTQDVAVVCGAKMDVVMYL
jgi:hypothetical protein